MCVLNTTQLTQLIHLVHHQPGCYEDGSQKKSHMSWELSPGNAATFLDLFVSTQPFAMPLILSFEAGHVLQANKLDVT